MPRIVVEQVGPWYPEVVENAAEIERVVRAEEERFRETLDRGMKEFEELAGADIGAADAFRLAATYGFPIELTVELARERGHAVDVDGYRVEMERHREISRGTGEKGLGQRAADFAQTAGFATEFVGYAKVDVLTQLGALEDLGDGTFLAKLRESPFYPAGGGQVTDQGWIERDDDAAVRAELIEAYRFDADQVLVLRGHGFASGDRVRAVVPWAVRFPTMANHTATHLLQAALREVLGEHVVQAGSAVRPDKLRFDFTHASQLTPEEREAIEQRVNRAIFANVRVNTFETTLDEARRLGAMALFGEKYGDVVRVVDVEGTSTELCGGTHVRSTAEIGAFAILGEGSVGGGTRRIEAVTSGEAWVSLRARATEADALRAELEETRRELKRKPQAAEATADPDAVVIVRRRRQCRRAGRRRLRGRRPPRPLRPAQAAAHTGGGGARLRRRRQGVARRELRRRGREPCQRRGRDPRGGPARGRRRRRTSDDGPRGRQGRREAPRGAGRGGAADPRGPVKTLALDYGAARTGVAVSDATGTLARPVGIVERAASEAGPGPGSSRWWPSTRPSWSSSGSR